MVILPLPPFCWNITVCHHDQLEVLSLTRKEQKPYAEATTVCVKNESYNHKAVSEKEICASYAVTPYTIKNKAMVCSKCLEKRN